ncbi:hypothetical protein F0562_006311 [Nyssa sinensis]|uniref:Uncharacterized protein n=1 Tax=Nyssa sinensis TaxID=561372 RepID=A0A5J5APC2_9ASTE|nr:hypothetical protein F0562_006311 [Nyssa sinensis]
MLQWFFDSGATHHVISNVENLQQLEHYTGAQKVAVGNGKHLDIDHRGDGTLPTPTNVSSSASSATSSSLPSQPDVILNPTHPVIPSFQPSTSTDLFPSNTSASSPMDIFSSPSSPPINNSAPTLHQSFSTTPVEPFIPAPHVTTSLPSSVTIPSSSSLNTHPMTTRSKAVEPVVSLEMARNCADEKGVHSNSIDNEVEEEEEEAFSLCDLPINEENQSRKEEAQTFRRTEEDFDFGSSAGSVLTKSEMCSADEVFFQGQILPLRHSISSDSGLAGFSRNPSWGVSRSESMDHCYSGGFTSVSSRSSSIRSYHSSSSGSSTAAAATTKTKYKPRVRNQFHSHPSPTPQIRVSSNIRHGNVSHRCQKSTIWSFFRVGLVRTPEIELQDLKDKVRGNYNNNPKSFGSRNSTTSSDSNYRNGNSSIEKKKKQSFFDKNGALFGSCKCSVNAIETVPSRIVLIKSNSVHVNETFTREEKEETVNKTKQQNGKQTMSRHRTFEWLKELSLAGVPDESIASA